MIILNEGEVEELLSMEACIAVMEQTFADWATGAAVQPLRTAIPIAPTKVFGLMPAHLRKSGVVGAKVITVYPENHAMGMPSHQGVVLVFNQEDGRLQAVVDGTSITAVRTAAVSAVATRLLARQDASTLAILGSGAQAKSHLEAMLLVRPIRHVKVWSRNRDHADRFAEEMRARFTPSIETCSTVSDAVAGADVICTVTSANQPILDDAFVTPGVHINAVGACQKDERELTSNLVAQSEFYVDSLEAAMHEAGDYLFPLAEGRIGEKHIRGELGDVLLGNIPARQHADSVTVFESLGLAVEDLAVARFLYEEATRLHRGTRV